MPIPDKDTLEIINSFITEGFERLDDAESRMQFLETGDYIETVNTIFRLFHSIKGSAGFLNFENIKKVTHEAETLLDIFRKENRRPSPEDTDLLYQALDVLRNMIHSVEKNMNDHGLEQETGSIIINISKAISRIKQSKEIQIDDKNKFTDSLDGLITDEMVEKFISESLDLLDKSEKEALEMEKNPAGKEGVKEIFRNIHTIKGNSGFFGFADIEKISMELENTLDRLRKSKKAAGSNTITRILKGIDEIRFSIKNSKTGEEKNPLTGLDEYKPLGEILVAMGETTSEAVESALEDQSKPLGEILIEKGCVNESTVQKALEIQQGIIQKSGMAGSNITRKEIRVDMSKLDRLFDMVGELVTAEAMVVNNPDLAGMKLFNFNKAANSLNKICREIQELTMMIRMIPLEGLFTKMNRLVRDLTRKFEKKVNLVISGEDTEMDRNVIEQISDPLVHIIRNSIDHGIENRDTRLKYNKEETGNVFLNARYEGNEVWISVRDDGGGLNREKILKKAREKNILVKDESNYTDAEVWQIIFEPGFSTAEKVSDISGRGVGMDVVKKNMEKLCGKADIISEVGKGTETILKIPLTMAILEGIIIQVGSEVFSIPTGDVVECMKASGSMIATAGKDGEVFCLRGEILPVIKLWEVFKIKTELKGSTDGILLILKSKDKKVSLLVDKILGNQQIVIKSVSQYLGSIEGISGCSILGNGNVCFIIDTERLVGRRME